MTDDDWNLEVAATTVDGEADGEPDEAIQAIAYAIVNRHRAGRWYSGQTLADCCVIAEQFSCWNDEGAEAMDRRRMVRKLRNDPTLNKCRAAVVAALSGSVPDPTGGATHYYSAGIPAPKWTVGATACGQFGREFFFKNVA